MPDTNRTIDLDDTLRVLVFHYRRWILYLLMEQQVSTIDEVVSELQILEKAVTGETVTKTRVMVRLNQIDLPKLVDADFIEYDRRNEDIVLTNDSDELRDLLAITKKWEDPAVRTELSRDTG